MYLVTKYPFYTNKTKSVYHNWNHPSKVGISRVSQILHGKPGRLRTFWFLANNVTLSLHNITCVEGSNHAKGWAWVFS